MSYSAQRLYELLPTIHRSRDAEQGEPLRGLLTVIANQVAWLEENLDQLYDDQFIETCADWVVPYIGDLVGYRALHGVTPAVASPRAEVANTIGYRRRKGTAAMLEQMARDVTGWPARAVEFFELLAATQYMNHLRPHCHWAPDLRRWEALERLGTAFESTTHSLEVRRIPTGAGRYNIQNVGLFLWRLGAYRLRQSPAVAVDARRMLFSPLGDNLPLFTRPVTEDRITHLAEPINVPEPISRRVLAAHLGDYYGDGKSLLVEANGAPVPIADVQVCNLADDGAGWAHQPVDKLSIDPVLGRLAFPLAQDPPEDVFVTFHYGFSADLGGGPYERGASLPAPAAGQELIRVPDDQATIQNALDALNDGGVVEITDSGRYEETVQVSVPAGATIELRAANGERPTLLLTADMEISGGADASFTLNGLLVAAAPGGPEATLRVADVPGNELRRLSLRHCTLVPGQLLDVEGTPQRPEAPSLVAEILDLGIEIDHCIIGALRVEAGSAVAVNDSIIDATEPWHVAIAAGDGVSAGGALTLRSCTVIGKLYAESMDLVSNSILLAELAASGESWNVPVKALRKQDGCVRFSWTPPDAILPRRYRCQPDTAVAAEIDRIERATSTKLDAASRAAIRAQVEAWLVPGFISRRYGLPAYMQLRRSAPLEIRAGADDESEMGAFHDLFQPQRETNLRVRLEEYLRLGLDAGMLHST